jgi:acyl carrier protein
MLKEKIEEIYKSVLEQTDRSLTVDLLEDSTVLLDSGLDSLGFVILVSVLGDELGFDPFASMQEPSYPQTFGEFVAIYENHISTDTD